MKGVSLSSKEFTDYLSNWVADGIGHCHLIIGGADGLDAKILEKSNLNMSFGKMVWPHMLVRVMLSNYIEQQLFLVNLKQ